MNVYPSVTARDSNAFRLLSGSKDSEIPYTSETLMSHVMVPLTACIERRRFSAVVFRWVALVMMLPSPRERPQESALTISRPLKTARHAREPTESLFDESADYFRSYRQAQ